MPPLFFSTSCRKSEKNFAVTGLDQTFHNQDGENLVLRSFETPSRRLSEVSSHGLEKGRSRTPASFRVSIYGRVASTLQQAFLENDHRSSLAQGEPSCTIFPAGPPFVGVQSKYATVLTFPPLIHSAGDWPDRVDALFATWKWPERRWPDPPKDQMSRYLNKTCVRQGFECHL